MPDKTNKEHQSKINNDEVTTDISTMIFWLLWTLSLILIPFYGFTLLFEVDVVKEGNLGSQLSPIIGLVVLIAQFTVCILSFKQKRQQLPLSRPMLTLLGGSIIIGLIWAGGCSIMGPLYLH